MKNLRQSQRCLALLLTTALILPLCLSSGAEGAITGSFQFDLDQNLIALNGKANIYNLKAAIETAVADNDSALEAALRDSLHVAEITDYGLEAMWRPYVNVLMERERPGVYLSNDTGSTANIVGFEILLSNPLSQFMPFENGDFICESYASGEYKLFDMDTYGFEYVDPDQVPVSASILDAGKRLALTFGNGGIQPGRATTFNIYSSMGIHLEEFFDDDTEINLLYENDLGESVSTGQRSLGDLGTNGGISGFNDDLMAQVAGGLRSRTMHFNGMVDSYSTGMQPINPVPEPTSLLLLGSGLGLFALRRRRMAH